MHSLDRTMFVTKGSPMSSRLPKHVPAVGRPTCIRFKSKFQEIHHISGTFHCNVTIIQSLGFYWKIKGKPPFFKSSQAQVKSLSPKFGQVKSQGQNISKSSLKSSRRVKNLVKSSRKVNIFSSLASSQVAG